jgi:transmembrane sensor
VSDTRDRAFPDDVAREVTNPAERQALEALWTTLAAAQPAPVVTSDESAAMWAAIVAGTSVAPVAAPVPVQPSVPTALPPQRSAQAMSPPAAEAALGVRAGATRPVAPPSARPAWARRRGGLLAGASLCLALAATVGRPGDWQEVRVASGSPVVHALPDGSTITLDAGSQLRYRDGFRGWFGRAADRRTELEGTAYFAVARDGRPFSVQTHNATVRVLGTEFAVEAWPTEGIGTRVAVAEGRVALSGRSAQSTALDAGEHATVALGNDTPGSAGRLPVERVAPWRTGGLVAIDEPLAHVVATLARRHGVEITFGESALGERRLSLYYPDAELERVLTDVATMQGLTMERRRGGYLLRLP